MEIFKFGGASVNSVERIQNLGNLVKEYGQSPMVIIVSAMGKTTNALEKVVEAFFSGKKEEAIQLFQAIKQQHINTTKYLLVKEFNPCFAQLSDFFTEAEWMLHDQPVREWDYYYDQLVCLGELFSTTIISFYLKEVGIPNQWLDVRDLIRTDQNFRDANIDWEISTNQIKQQISKYPKEIIVTQGFIGATDENESTTLGREGSDYTAAVFAHVLDAEKVVIWKDVEAVMSADPKVFPEATPLPELSFQEVLEMSFYGAQVIHPKTIQPLFKKGIPLFVKCFTNPNTAGTVIHKKQPKELPPIWVHKKSQVLLELKTQDYGFVGEAPMRALYNWLENIQAKPNLIQSGAISVQLVMDDGSRMEKLAQIAGSLFDVQVMKQLELLTIRNYTDELIEKYAANKTILLIQQTPKTVQILYQS